MINQKRIFYYDLIRVFAIFCVVSCHVSSSLVLDITIFNTNLWYFSLVLNSLRDIGVPLFVMLTGSLLLFKHENYKIFFKKRVEKVLIPYVFWVVIFLIFIFVGMHYNYFTNYTSVESVIFNTLSFFPKYEGVFLWFVPMILTVYIIIFVINKLTELNVHIVKFFLIFSLVLVVLFNLNLFVNNDLLNYFLYSIFAVLGYYCSIIDFNKLLKINISNNKLFILFFISSLILYSILIKINAYTSMASNQFLVLSQFNILNILLVLSVFLSFRYFSMSENKLKSIYMYLKENFGKIVLSLSFCSYGIYLCHVIIKICLDKIIMSLFKNMLPMSINLIILLVLTFICSWICILVVHKIPFLSKFSGY